MKFTITTQKNAVPYKRTTQRQMYKDLGYQKYQRWKTLVKKAFMAEFGKYPKQVFKKNEKYYMDIKIYFFNKAHGDSDNVFKGISDALFEKPLNDKFIAGSFDFFYDKEKPRVEVEIQTETQKRLEQLKKWQDNQNAKFLAKEFAELL